MGQKHSRPSASGPQNQEHLLQQQQQQSQQQPQPNQQQPSPAAPQGYAASHVYPAQHPPQPYGGYTNGQYYGRYSPGPYGGAGGGPPMYQPTHYGQTPRPHVPTAAVRQTQTIKNQVNLIKKTLRLEPHPADPTQLLLSFAFSATAPCRVSTFVLATEDPGQSLKIVGALPGPRTPAYYEKGVNLQFPQSDAIAQQHAIRLVSEEGQHWEQPLQTPGGNSYPLVIRLETLTQQAAADGKQLQQLPVGGALPDWAQAQCTYAKLKRDDDNKWVLQVLKQKIWVDGVSYELQEIYGMEATRTAGGGAAAEDVDGRECVICMSAPRDTTVLPCRHMCICKACADALRNQTNKCPICREPMESLLHIKQ